jgi:hypothetical protein
MALGLSIAAVVCGVIAVICNVIALLHILTDWFD